ncbi:MAG: hypothetical protein KAT39_13080 [Alphaproteobacteria bacterium]|nr:hypothetical protein [Alphaproteobacteria bacterium]
MPSVPVLAALLDRIEAATGADRAIDAAIEQALRGPAPKHAEGRAQAPPDYTASVDHCLDLLHALLPSWHWHLGRGARGIMPYASLSKGRATVSAGGTTVPLVLLAAIVKALQKGA